jgi:hypothetical protein
VTSFTPRIRIDQIAMTGPGKKLVRVTFVDDVNIIWGASNAGKSFIRKSIDYVFGAEKITLPTEGIGYDNLILWLTTPTQGSISLRRSSMGGDIYKVLGHSENVVASEDGYQVLKASHSPQSPNISKFILQESGFRDAVLLKNERAKKQSFTLRVLMRYLIVDETRMIDEKSSLLGYNQSVTAEDKGLIKFLLTGVDGSSVEEVRSADQIKATKEGKIEALTALANQVCTAVDPDISDEQMEGRLAQAKLERDNLLEVVTSRQDSLDELSAKVRIDTTNLRNQESQIAELSAMLLRFSELETIFASDLDRLSGLSEGGFLLQAFGKMNCPVCGAEPDHQHHDHGFQDIDNQRAAADAEIAKIKKEDAELKIAIADGEAERAIRVEAVGVISRRRSQVQKLLQTAQETENTARSIFSSASEKVAVIERELENRRLLAVYEAQIALVSAQSVRARQRAEGLDLNLDLTTNEANELSKVVKRVLTAWNYPGADAVHFDPVDQDIVVDGKRRRDNGAGIRAILHSAFKVALMVFCKEAGRPHPGFIVLDSPLLAYRPADEPSELGELTEEELALQQANLAEHFYAHLHSIRHLAQVIVIENHKADQDVVKPYPNTRFTRNASIGRAGFFG